MDDFHLLGTMSMNIEHFFMVRRFFASGVSLFVDPTANLFLTGHSVVNAKLLQASGGTVHMSSTASVSVLDTFTVTHDSHIIVTLNCMGEKCAWGGFYSALIEASTSSTFASPAMQQHCSS